MRSASIRRPRGLKAARPNPRDETLELQAERLILEHELTPDEATVMVAVSGGPDSVALLDFLLAYRDRRGIARAKTVVAHVNHGLRGNESDVDQEFVREFAARLGVRCVVAQVDAAALRANGAGRRLAAGAQPERTHAPENTARTLRYRALRELCAREGADRLAVAHNADDQAETVLLRLIRGAGLLGLSGMLPMRRLRRAGAAAQSLREAGRPAAGAPASELAQDISLVRPLLTTTREQVLAYLAGRGLISRTDSTNLLTDARRNFLRLEILPRIRERMNPAVRETLLREAAWFREIDAHLTAEARQAFPELVREREPGKLALDASKLLLYPEVLRKYLIRIALQELNGDILDLATAHVQALHSLLLSQTGRSAHIPGGIRAQRERETLVLKRSESRTGAAGLPSKA